MGLILLKIWAFVQSACKFNDYCGSTGGFANTKGKKDRRYTYKVSLLCKGVANLDVEKQNLSIIWVFFSSSV